MARRIAQRHLNEGAENRSLVRMSDSPSSIDFESEAEKPGDADWLPSSEGIDAVLKTGRHEVATLRNW